MSVHQLGFEITVPSAPTATPGSASGSLDAVAVYQYKVTYITGFGETSGGSTGFWAARKY